ncbi:MAG: hypothetical protein ACRD4L_09195, partial [Pyrinomonadaceae bacterium]
MQDTVLPDYSDPRDRISGIDEIETLEAESGERIIFVTRPTFLFIGVGYILCVLAAIVINIGLAYLGINVIISLALSALIFVFPIYAHILRSTVLYTLTDSRIEIACGFLHRT